MPSDVMQEARATIVVVDDKELRRAAVVSFLMPWAGAMDAAVEAVERIGDVPAEQLAQARLVVVNVGGERCGDAAVREALQAVREAASEVGVAVLADSGRTEDMVAAFQIGADGYVPTSTEPRIALQALGFIAAGVQFFPPTALVAATAARSG